MVDLDAACAQPPAEALAAAAVALAQLPCPAIALCADSYRSGSALGAASFDVVVYDESELAEVAEGALRCPLAAQALVQLLRHGQGLDVHEGLIAESLAYSTLQAGPEFAAWVASRPRAAATLEPSSGPAVQVLRDGDVLHLTLNRPERHNAFSAEMRDALVEGLRIALGDPSVREVVLSGAGPSFSSGGDLDEFGSLPDPAVAHAVRSTRNASRMLAACASRVHARVHGACVGAGVELPAYARRVTAAEDSWFQLPELPMGLIPGAGGTVSLPRRIGRQRTAFLALTGRRIDVETALAWGLVDEVAARRA